MELGTLIIVRVVNVLILQFKLESWGLTLTIWSSQFVLLRMLCKLDYKGQI